MIEQNRCGFQKVIRSFGSLSGKKTKGFCLFCPMPILFPLFVAAPNSAVHDDGIILSVEVVRILTNRSKRHSVVIAFAIIIEDLLSRQTLEQGFQLIGQ